MKRFTKIFLTTFIVLFVLSACSEQTLQASVQNQNINKELAELPENIYITDNADVSDSTAEIKAEEAEVVSDETNIAEETEIVSAETNITEEIKAAPEESEEILVTEITEQADNQPQPEPPPVVYVPVTGITLSVYDVTLSTGHKTLPYVTMHPANSTDKGEIWTSSDTTVATVDRYGNITAKSEGQCTVTVYSTDNQSVYATVNVTVIPEAECTYIDGILIVNKTYPLPKSYAPGWDETASAQLQVMFTDAKNEGLSFWVKSGYRSYVDQYIIYNNYVSRDGVAAADRYSARPGHSEHQSGLAFDLNSLSSAFGETPEGIWLAENCHKYGFIIRYPKDKESITGYMYEPWHVRYIGIEKATEVYESGLCLEEFLGITSEYSY